jgi:ABC-type branched-subunit amino acid transport system substrate-binding protein
VRSASASRRVARSTTVVVLFVVVVAFAAAEPAPEPRTLAIGWIPAKDAGIARDLEDGATLAIERAAAAGEARLVLRTGAGGGPWGTVAASAVRLVAEEGAVVLVSPPEREAAHLLAQVGTKMRVPVVVTSRVPSVTQAGTSWALRIVPRGADETEAPPAFDLASPGASAFVQAFTARFRRAPSAWSAAGHDAVRAVVAARARRRTDDAPGLLAALRALDGPPGAAAPLRFDARGDRLVR